MAGDNLSPVCRNCGGPIEIMCQKNSDACCGLCEKALIWKDRDSKVDHGFACPAFSAPQVGGFPAVKPTGDCTCQKKEQESK